MKDRFQSKTYRISLTAMFAAMTLIVLYLTAVVPSGKMALYFLSSIFVSGLLVERQPGMALLLFAVVTGLGFLIVPVVYMFPYLLLFGHYGIGKYYIEKGIHDKIIAYVLKLVYFNVAMVGVYFLAAEVFLSGILAAVPLWGLIVGAQVVFVIYDFLYSKVTLFYYQSIRRKIIRD